MGAHSSVHDDSPAPIDRRTGNDERSGEDANSPVRTLGRDREIVQLLNELEERPVEEAGYGHGV